MKEKNTEKKNTEKWWEEFELVKLPRVPSAGNIYMNEKCVIFPIQDYNRFLKANNELNKELSAVKDRNRAIQRTLNGLSEALNCISTAIVDLLDVVTL